MLATGKRGRANRPADGTGAGAVIRFLEERGDRYLFGVTGSSMVSLFYDLKQSPIRFVTSVHEGAAMAMADGYARVTGHAYISLYMMQGSANAMATSRTSGRRSRRHSRVSTSLGCR